MWEEARVDHTFMQKENNFSDDTMVLREQIVNMQKQVSGHLEL